jgi:threonine/homoserine/homoserine lactone efflux protein
VVISAGQVVAFAVAAQMLILSAISIMIGLASDSCWGLAASTVRSWFARSPRRVEVVGGAGGMAMIGLGLTLALAGRRAAVR